MSSLYDTYELDGRQKAFRALIITSFSITGAFVATRCWVRLRLQAQFTADDYLLVTALAVYAIQTSFGLYAIDYGGFGRAAAEIPPAVYAVGFRWTILTQCTYPLALLFAKLSIALLQLRIMGLSTSPWLRRTHHASMAVSVLIALLGFLTALIQCDVGDGDAGGIVLLLPTVRCHSRAPNLVSGYVYSAFSIALDWYYALAMVPAIWALRNVPPAVRLSVIVILGMGVLASVATVVRLVYLVRLAHSRELLLDVVPVALWSTVEGCVGMCAACLATFRPLLRSILAPLSSRYGEGGSSSRASSGRSGGSGGGKKGRRGEVVRMEELETGLSAAETLQSGYNDTHGDVEYGGERRSNEVRRQEAVEHAEDDRDAIRTNCHTDRSTTITTIRSSNAASYLAAPDDEESKKSILRHKSASLTPS